MAVTQTKVELNRTVSIMARRDSAGTSRKLEEARAHVQRAERKTKPSVKRWKPCFSQAGEEYCKAAIVFYGLGEVDECKMNLLKACECFKKKRAWYSAAKTLEQAMTITQKQGDYTNMTELAWRSAALFRKAGQPDSAAQLLERAARAIGGKQPENSVLMLEKAAETVETENRPIQAANYIAKLLRLALEKKDKEEAIDKSRKLVELYQEAGHKPSTGRYVLGLVVLLVHIHRTGEAEIVAREFGNNCSRDQNTLIEDLLDAYDQNDAAKVQATMRSKVLSSLDLEFKPVLDSMSLPEQWADSGPRPRTRTRRIFSVAKPPVETSSGDDKSTTAATTTTAGSSRCTTDDEKDKDKDEQRKQNKAGPGPGRAPIYQGEDLKLESDDSTTTTKKKISHALSKEESASGKAKGKAGEDSSRSDATDTRKKRGGRNPLVKMPTHDEITSPKRKSSSGKSRKEPSAYIDVTTDSVSRHRPGNLPAPAPYVDVEGVDNLQPAYMGMTVEQWRAFKRSHAASDDNELAIEETLGDIGEGTDW